MTMKIHPRRALQPGSVMVPDKAIDLVDELLRDLHLRELDLVELANRIVRSHNFTDLGLTLGQQRMLRRLRELLASDEWWDLPRLVRERNAVQRETDKATRAELRPLLGRLNEAFERDYLSADNAFASDCDAALLDEHGYDRLKTEFVRNWAKYKVDRDQAAAVSVTRGDVLVTARAGSGKTRTLVARTLFLLRHCRVSPREILLLAFNRPAVEHIKDEIRKAIEGDAPLPHVMTFHALAHAIVRPDEHLVFDDPGADSLGRSRETQESIDEFIRLDGRERRLIRNIMLPLFRGDWERIIEGRFHLPMDELLKCRHSLPRETLNGERVKSYGEKVIANTLFEHGVKYEYERSFPWNGVNYRPDFTIQPQSPIQGSQSSDHGGVVIEYFGLKGQSDYDTMSKEKQAFWRRRPEAFLEYTPRDIASRSKDAFVERLLNDLRRVRVPCRRRSEEEIWQLVRKRAVDSFSEAMTNFIGRCRKQNLSVASLQNMVVTHEPMNTAEERFLKAAIPIYSRYGERLAAGGKEDFDGLMWRAIERLQNGTTRFTRDRGREQGDLRRLRFVMIDEFQDFSRMFLELTSAIRSANPDVCFFAVGDDWQAINAFAGSDLEFFKNFEKYFHQNTRTLSIRTNYRSAASIVEASNSVMRGQGEPARPHRSEAGSAKVGHLDDFRSRAVEEEQHRWDSITPAVLRLLHQFLETGKTDAKVVLLSRTKFVPWTVFCNHKPRHDRTLDGFLAHVRSYVDESDCDRVNVATAHSYKGREQSAVIVLDAPRYPLVHPHWIFTRVFSDRVDRIVEEERRLLYVAMTRAMDDLVLLTETGRESPLIADIVGHDSTQRLSWEGLATPPPVDGERVEVRIDNCMSVDQTKRLLKDLGYKWNSQYWYRTFPAERFSFDDLLRQPWAAHGVCVTVHDATDGRLLRRHDARRS